MLGNRELILIIIFIICVISIIIVKLYYRKHSEADRDIKIFNRSPDGGYIARKNHEETEQIISQQPSYENDQYYPMEQNTFYPKQQVRANPYEVNPTNYYKPITNNIKEGDTMKDAKETEEKAVAEKISEEPKEVDQSTKKETYTEIAEEQPKTNDKDLKDLFTIDELIKESKRKSKVASAPKTEKKGDSSSKKEIPTFLTQEEREKIKNNISKAENEIKSTKASEELEESVEEVENENIKDVLDKSVSPISSPILKSPKKSTDKPVNEVIKDTVAEKIDEIQPQVDQSTKKETYTEIAEEQPEYVDQPLENGMFAEAIIDNDEEEDEYDDLDYRKDLARITDKVKNSKLFTNVKDKLSPPVEEDDPSIDEEFIRNVRSYDENGDDDEFGEPVMYEPEGPKIETAKDLHIKEVPNTDRIQVKINNNDATLKKGDEIIYKYNGDTYSSKVFDIMGDDITVRFRGKQITIKPGDVKKIF